MITARWAAGTVAAALLAVAGVSACGGSQSSAPQSAPASASQVAGTDDSQMAAWLTTGQVQGQLVRPVHPGVLLGLFQGHPFTCVKTTATDLGKYGVSASESVGPWLCGIVDGGGLPDQQANSAFARAIGW